MQICNASIVRCAVHYRIFMYEMKNKNKTENILLLSERMKESKSKLMSEKKNSNKAER